MHEKVQITAKCKNEAVGFTAEPSKDIIVIGKCWEMSLCRTELASLNTEGNWKIGQLIVLLESIQAKNNVEKRASDGFLGQHAYVGGPTPRRELWVAQTASVSSSVNFQRRLVRGLYSYSSRLIQALSS
jgi:hypothetical protein